MPAISERIQSATGAPSSVRVGTVETTNPVTVSVQGVVFDDVGLLGSFPAQVGDPVVLLGQSPTSGTDPTSWIALGKSSAAGQQIFLASLSASVNIPAAPLALSGTTINFTTTAPSTMVQAWYTADLESVGATLTQATVRPVLDGVALGAQTFIVYDMPVANDGRFTLGQQTFFTVGPGAHSIYLEAAAGVANMIRASANNTSIMITVHG